MTYRQPILERLSTFLEQVWRCEIKQKHHVKMDSHGHCYRCGRLIDKPQPR